MSMPEDAQPVVPLDYTDARSAEVLGPIVYTSSMVLLCWSALDSVYYLMMLRSLLAGGVGMGASSWGVWTIITPLGTLSSVLMFVGAWQATSRRPTALKLMLIAEVIWFLVLVGMQIEMFDYYIDLTRQIVPPGTSLSERPWYTLLAELCRQAGPFVATIGFVLVLRLPILREYFAAQDEKLDTL